MRAKQTIVAICCILAFCLLSACQSRLPDASPADDKAGNADDVIYESEAVKVSLIDNAAKFTDTSVDYEWMRLSQEEAYTKNPVILTGTVSNIRECFIEIKGREPTIFNNMTIFDVTVDEVLSCHSDSFPDRDVITMAVGYNSVTFVSELPQIKEGASYLMFCCMANDERNVIPESRNYVDCWIYDVHDLFCEKVGDYYLTNDYFSDLSSTGSLADTAGITDMDISINQTHWLDADSRTARKCFEDIVSSSPLKDAKMRDAALDALMVLHSRIRTGGRGGEAEGWALPSGGWLDIQVSYIINCKTLEDHIRAAAAKYAG